MVNCRLMSAALALAFMASHQACAPEAQFGGASLPPQDFGAPVVTSKTFAAGRIDSGHMAYSLGDEVITQDLEMKAEAPTVASFRQIERPRHRDRFVQGNPGQAFSRTMPVREAGKLDLLVVIDDSPSMKPYQDRLAPQLEPVLRHIGNTDWQIAVVTTSPTTGTDKYGCLRGTNGNGHPKILTKAAFDADPERVKRAFASHITAGETGRTVERGVYASVIGLRGDCGDPDKRWIRAGANYAVLIITDEENCGSASNEHCHDLPGEFPQYFIDNTPPGTKFLGLFYDELTPPCAFQGWRRPQQYWDLVAATGGIWGNMCETDYTPILERISAHIGPVVRYDYKLEHSPVPGSVKVLLDGRDITNRVVVDGDNLRVTGQITDDERDITISYRHDPVPILTRYRLRQAAAPETIAVLVNGSVAGFDTYAFEPAVGEIVFNQAPPDDAVVEIGYRGQVTLPSTFAIAAVFVPETIRIEVDDRETSDFEVDADTGIVTLATPPVDGALVLVTYETPAGRQLAYPATVPGNAEVESTAAYDRLTNEPVAVSLSEGALIFDRHDVRPGRGIRVELTLRPDVDEFEVALPSATVNDTIRISTGQAGGTCAAAAERTEVGLRFPCPARDLGGLAVDFSWVAELSDTFTMPGTFVAEATWQVFVDDVEITDFERDGGRIRIPQTRLAHDTVVRIEVREPQWAKGRSAGQGG